MTKEKVLGKPLLVGNLQLLILNENSNSSCRIFFKKTLADSIARAPNIWLEITPEFHIPTIESINLEYLLEKSFGGLTNLYKEVL